MRPEPALGREYLLCETKVGKINALALAIAAPRRPRSPCFFLRYILENRYIPITRPPNHTIGTISPGTLYPAIYSARLDAAPANVPLKVSLVPPVKWEPLKPNPDEDDELLSDMLAFAWHQNVDLDRRDSRLDASQPELCNMFIEDIDINSTFFCSVGALEAGQPSAAET